MLTCHVRYRSGPDLIRWYWRPGLYLTACFRLRWAGFLNVHACFYSFGCPAHLYYYYFFLSLFNSHPVRNDQMRLRRCISSLISLVLINDDQQMRFSRVGFSVCLSVLSGLTLMFPAAVDAFETWKYLLFTVFVPASPVETGLYIWPSNVLRSLCVSNVRRRGATG